jgi:aryl carrier-like protein
MSVGLIEGWQHHADELRQETPLLDPPRWERALRDRGFDRVAFYPPAGSPAEVLGHHIIVASSSAPVVASAAVAPVREAPAREQKLVVPTAAKDPTSDPDGSLRDRLVALTVGERRDLLQQMIQRQVIRVMRLRASAAPPAMNDRLMSIGMDSLMAVDLKKQLSRELGGAVTLPSTLIFDHPTIEAIAAFVLSALGLDERSDAAPKVAPAAPKTNDPAAAIADLSEAEVEALLTEQLKGLL